MRKGIRKEVTARGRFDIFLDSGQAYGPRASSGPSRFSIWPPNVLLNLAIFLSPFLVAFYKVGSPLVYDTEFLNANPKIA